MNFKNHREQILSALHSNCSITYMTQVSIIQSVALALLGNELLQAREQPIYWPPVVATFLCIVIVWEECKLGTTALFWVTNLIDSSIPFVVGACEFLLIGTMLKHDLQSWYFSLGLIYAVGILWYLNVYIAARKEDQLNEAVLSRVRPFIWLNPIVCFGYSVIFASMGLFTNRLSKHILAAVVLGLIVAFFVKAVLFWNRIVKYAKATENDSAR